MSDINLQGEVIYPACQECKRLRAQLAAARAAIVHCRAHSGYLPGASDELLCGLLDSITRICDKALAGKDAT